jgi:hypothetical protein
MLTQPLRDGLQVGDELLHRGLPLRVVLRPQDRGRMSRDRHQLGQVGFHGSAAVTSDPDLRAKQRLSRGCAEQDDRGWLYNRELGPQPRQAGVHLPAVGLLVDATLSADLEAEMLHNVRDVGIAGRDSRPVEPLVEDPAGRTDERVALDVLAVPGLLADQHHGGSLGPFTHHGLGGVRVQVAGPAGVDRAVQVAQRGMLGYRRGGSIGHPFEGAPTR